MSGFKSDAQRKHYFANNGSSGTVAGLPKEFTGAQMDAMENDYAAMWAESDQFVRNPGFKNPMPTMTAEESAIWRAGTFVPKL